jgi:hypothetical protein
VPEQLRHDFVAACVIGTGEPAVDISKAVAQRTRVFTRGTAGGATLSERDVRTTRHNSLVEHRPRRKKKKQPVRTTTTFCALLLTAVVSSNAIEANPLEELLWWQHSLFDDLVHDTEIEDEIIDPRTPPPLHWSESASGGCSVHDVLNHRDAALPHHDISLAPQPSSALMEDFH